MTHVLTQQHSNLFGQRSLTEYSKVPTFWNCRLPKLNWLLWAPGFHSLVSQLSLSTAMQMIYGNLISCEEKFPEDLTQFKAHITQDQFSHTPSAKKEYIKFYREDEASLLCASQVSPNAIRLQEERAACSTPTPRTGCPFPGDSSSSASGVKGAGLMALRILPMPTWNFCWLPAPGSVVLAVWELNPAPHTC